MKKYIDPFLANVPFIDIHGYDRISATVEIKLFIDNYYGRLGEKKLIIIHGIGSGILRKSTHEYLSKDKRVLEYKTDNFNNGQTIVKLK